MSPSLSVWLANAGATSSRAASRFPSIAHAGATSLHFDTLVVGAGLFGCTTAYLLKSLGHRVGLVEARSVGRGTSGHSTAKLSAQQGAVYSMIQDSHNPHIAREYYEMNQEGIEMVSNIVQSLNLNCHFERRSHIAWTSDPNLVQTVRREYNISKSLNIPCDLLEPSTLEAELPRTINPLLGVSFPNQAQFNSYLYCSELCNHIDGDNGKVFEDSRVVSVSQGVTEHTASFLDTPTTITARRIVLATHLPIMDRSTHFAILNPSRSHCVAARLAPGSHSFHNMFINIEKPTRSIRLTEDPNVLVVCGDSIPQGEESAMDQFYNDLATWTRTHFNVEDIFTTWSSMDYFSADHIPFIGYLYSGSNSIYTGTGFSKWGHALGAAGAQLIVDLIQDKPNRFHKMVDARRWGVMHQYKGALEENIHVSKHLVGDKVSNLLTLRSVDSLRPKEGGICKVGMQKVGAYHDEHGKHHFVRPVCTHLGCDLVFNRGDATWDCPCHGSQFSVDGEVLHGPAVKPLEQFKDLSW